MTEFLDFTPLFQESMQSIRDRLDADTNAGLEATDERRVDVRVGGFYYDMTQTTLVELARIWDALATEVPAASSPATAWGDYLEEHGAVFGVTRKPAVKATGQVRFSGVDGTLLAQGARVSTEQTDPDIDPVEFETSASATLAGRASKPTALVATAQAGGALAAGTYYYVVTASTEFGETEASAEVSVVVAASGKVVLTWTAPPETTEIGFTVYRGRAPGAEVKLVALMEDQSAVTYTDTGAVAVDETSAPSVVNGSAGAWVDVAAVEPGAAGNVATAAIVDLVTPIAGVEEVYNGAPTTGGTEPENDEELRSRVLTSYEGTGAGTVGDYRRWALEYPGVGRAFVEPLHAGPGTVKVVVLTSAGGPVAAEVVAGLQVELDPTPGLGGGKAPIGATVTVATPSVLLVPVTATVTFEAGFSLDGTGGSIATRATIIRALSDYLNKLEVGEDVVRNHIEAQFFTVRGVRNVALSAPAADVVVSTSQIANLGTVTLS